MCVFVSESNSSVMRVDWRQSATQNAVETSNFPAASPYTFITCHAQHVTNIRTRKIRHVCFFTLPPGASQYYLRESPHFRFSAIKKRSNSNKNTTQCQSLGSAFFLSLRMLGTRFSDGCSRKEESSLDQWDLNSCRTLPLRICGTCHC